MKNSLSANPVIISATENRGIDRHQLPQSIGIPFAMGDLREPGQVSLKNDHGEQIACHSKPLAYWPDNSIRWLLVDFKLCLAGHTAATYQLVTEDRQSPPGPAIDITRSGQSIHVENGAIGLDLDQHHFPGIGKVDSGGVAHPLRTSRLRLVDANDVEHYAVVDKVSIADSSAAIRSCLHMHGHFGSDKTGDFFKFESRISFYSDSPLVDLDITLKNPRRAEHKGGFWDLGDPGSLFFKSMTLEFEFDAIDKVAITNLENDAQSTMQQDFRIYQDSSGGKKWNHHIHVDQHGESTVSFKGFETTANGEVIERGDRTTPLVSVWHGNGQASEFHIDKFWQNFPKAVAIEGNRLKLEIFPQTPKSAYELQAGEQKTHTVSISLDSQQAPLTPRVTPLNLTLPLQVYYQGGALPGLPPTRQENALERLVDEGINGANSFFAKRESADEYGWRHFGETWADHETLEHGNDKSLVSHYNNQYDLVLGFLKQYMISGEHRWRELADDLVRHVTDIDMYHTDRDRPQYNQGQFWHTDHYLDGRYCTHRTFSRHHMEIDHVEQSGGGPGSEHCYTTGLLLHHFMTGSAVSEQALLKSVHWSKYVNEGDDTLLSRLTEFVKTDLKNVKRVRRGEYIFNYRFPLSRGTGNYVNTLLDHYLLRNDPAILEKALEVINGTFSYQDDISRRALMENIEGNWHYAVFLQSVVRCLEIMEQGGRRDGDYQQLLRGFLVYADFVLKNEKPYHENRQLLVYPNSTWIAQDIRKLYILHAYSKYAAEELQPSIQEKTRYFYDYACGELATTSDRSFTRIQAILLQSYIDYSATQTVMEREPVPQVEHFTPPLTVFSIIKGFVFDCLRRLVRISFRNEIRWLKFRLE